MHERVTIGDPVAVTVVVVNFGGINEKEHNLVRVGNNA